MPIRGEFTKKFPTFTNGVDDTSPVGSRNTENTLSVGLNADFTTGALVKTRAGYTKINTSAWSTRRVRHGFEYTVSSGVFESLVYGEASTPTGTSGILAKMAGVGVPTTIKSSLADSVKPSIVQFRTLAFVFNGTDDFIYDGTTTRQIGITTPASAPTLNTTINGNLVIIGSYIYAYSYYNSVTGAESSLSASSATLTAGATSILDGIRINIAAGSATTADTIRVYRSVNGGSALFLDGTTAISSTTYDSTVADSALVTAAEPDNSRLPGTAKYVVSQDNRLFVAGFTANPNRVQYSKIGQFGPSPESFQAADFADCNLNDGDKIIGLGTVNGIVLVLKQRSVGKLIPIGITTGSAEATGSQKYVYVEISPDITSLSHHTLISLDTFAVWMGTDDLYGTDGSQIYRFGKRVLGTYTTINFAQKWKFSAINKISAQQLVFSVCRAGQAEPDFQLVAHYRNFPNLAFSYYSPGLNTTTHPGIQAGTIFSATSNGLRIYCFGSSAAVGTVYLLDSGTNDDGLAIYYDCRLPWDDVGDPSTKSLYHSYFIFVSGPSTTSTITHIFERDRVAIIVKTATSTLQPLGAQQWSVPDWVGFSWPTQQIKPVGFFPHLKAYYARYGWQNTNLNEPYSIYNIIRVAQETPLHR